MAHEVETMAYVGEKPWHGLGVEVPDGISTDDLLNEAGLNWEIIKSPLIATNPVHQNMDSHFALVRDTDKYIMGICGKQYVPFQNKEVFKFFDRFVKAGKLVLNTAGALDHGRVVWGLAKVAEVNIGQDRIDGFLLLSQPHIWGKAMTVMFTAVRVVCMNTLTTALAGPGQRFSVPHIRAFDSDLITSISVAMGMAEERMTEYGASASFLASKRAESTDVLNYVSELFDPELFKLLQVEYANKLGGIKTLKQLSYNNLRSIGHDVYNSVYNSPGSGLESAKGTWWGAFNGVTYVVDHHIGRIRDLALNSAWFGKSAVIKRKALELAITYAKVA